MTRHVKTRLNRYSRILPIRTILGAIGVGLLGHVLWANRGSFREVLGHQPDLRYLVLAYVLCLSALTSTFVRWYVVVRSQGLPFPPPRRGEARLPGQCGRPDCPGQVGGDVLKAAYLCREQSRRTCAIASIMIDRVIGVLGLVLLASLMGALSWSASGPAVRKLIQVVWLVLAIGLRRLCDHLRPRMAAAIRTPRRAPRTARRESSPSCMR